ncbi:type II secretion system F family protein [Arthrobacter sp.]|uniref:type II secretion system F family protein n=1 Tax=Arthrobacter sp. TaxID=1667 RepID=UPI003A93EB4E
MTIAIAALLAGLAAWCCITPRANRHPPAGRPSPDTGALPRPDPPAAADVPLLLELAATLLDSGLPVDGVLATLARDVEPCRGLGHVVRSLELGVGWQRAWQTSPPTLRRLGESLAFAQLTGAATADLLRAAAEQERRAEARRAEKRAAELGVKLVIPLGICALPAFICLGIVPVVMALLPAAG